MTAAQLPHQAPYTVHDLSEMPDNTNRYEVLEGALIVSPSPDSVHQYFGDELRQRLKEAAPEGVFVLTAFTVRLGDDATAFIPDLVVTTTDPRRRRTLLDPHEVPAVVEIVSPSTGRRDRVLKPDAYASVGIGCYWRVELSPFRSPEPGVDAPAVPAVLVYELDGGCYRRAQTLPAGRVGDARAPFPVRFDPGRLMWE